MKWIRKFWPPFLSFSSLFVFFFPSYFSPLFLLSLIVLHLYYIQYICTIVHIHIIFSMLACFVGWTLAWLGIWWWTGGPGGGRGIRLPLRRWRGRRLLQLRDHPLQDCARALLPHLRPAEQQGSDYMYIYLFLYFHIYIYLSIYLSTPPHSLEQRCRQRKTSKPINCHWLGSAI